MSCKKIQEISTIESKVLIMEFHENLRDLISKKKLVNSNTSTNIEEKEIVKGN